MASAKILLFTHKTLNNGTHPIVLQIIKDRTRKIVSLGRSAYIDQWDAANNRPNKSHPNKAKLTLYLRKRLYEAEKIIIDFDEEGEPYTIEDIISKVKGDKSSRLVFKYAEEIIANLERTGRIGNAIVYKNTLSMFRKFRNKIDLEFNSLTYKEIKGFEEFLLENGRKVNTISVHLRTLRAIYNYAIKDKAAKLVL